MKSSKRSEVKINQEWIAHLKTQEQRDEFYKTLLNKTNDPVFTRLSTILARRLEALNTRETDTKIYSTPNWDYIQAHTNGERQQLQEILDLLDFSTSIKK